MSIPGELVRLTVRTTFAEAAHRARRLAALSGHDTTVRRGTSGFGVWVPGETLGEMSALLVEIDAHVLETVSDEEEMALYPEQVDEPEELEEPDIEQAWEEPDDDPWAEIREDIADEQENWAASEEDGWYYRD